MVSLLAAACSSSKSTGSEDSGVSNGTGGKTSGSGGSSAVSSGGSSSAAMCAADAGANACRACLAMNCCDAYTQCLADPKCNKALTTQIACFTSGDEPSFCFGNFSRALGGDSGVITPVPACIVTSCTPQCGGPGIV
jgi:hypothetical protein